MSNTFSINQQVFEIDFFSTAKAHELQNRISSIANGDLPVLMNRFFETVVPEEFLYKIDSLEIDVGEILYDRLEADLPVKIMEALTEQLSERFRFAKDPAFAQQSGVEVSRAHTGMLDLLEYFLLTGRLPWWAGKGVDLETVLEELFQHDRQALRTLILNAGRNEYVRRRIVHRFTGRHMRMVIEALEPQEAAFIFEYHQEVVKVQQEEHVIATEQKAFEQAVWLFILNYLVADRGGEFNKKTFVKQTLMQIASGFSIAYFDLLHVFFRALRAQHQRATGTIASLEHLVMELSNEDEGFVANELAQLHDSQPGVAVTDPNAMLARIDLLRYYLEYGTMPPAGYSITAEQLAALMIELAAKVPATLRAVLLAAASTKQAVQRVFAVLGAAGTKSFLKLVYEEKARSIGALGTTLELLQSEKALVSASNAAFRDVLWKLMLDIVMAARINITDDRVLVYSMIEGLRKSYGIPAQLFVENLHEGIRTVFYKDMRNLEHLGLIQRVLEEYADAKIENAAPIRHALSIDDLADPVQSQVEAVSAEGRSLRDLLRFLLSYGSMPWWGRSYFSETPPALLEKLEALSPRELLLLFRFAGTRRITQQRFLLQFPEATVLRIMRQLPAGEDAVRMWEQLRAMIILVQPDVDQRLLLQVLWEERITHNYQFATGAGLYFKTITRIARRYGRSVAGLVADLKEILYDWDGQVITGLRELIERVETVLLAPGSLQAMEETEVIGAAPGSKKAGAKKARIPTHRGHEFILQEHLFSAHAMLVLPKGVSEVEVIRDWLTGAEEQVRTGTTTKVFDTLEKFLATGHLPGSIDTADRQQADLFIKRLLLLAYHLDTAKIIALFQKHKGVLAIAHITALVTGTAGGEEKALSDFLQPVLAEYSYPFNTNLTEAAEAGEWQAPGTIEAIVSGFVSPGQLAGEEQLLQAAVSLIRYFLLWNRIPVEFKRLLPAGVAEVAVLRELLRLVFHRNANLLRETLRNEEYQQPALEAIYSITNTMRENGEQGIAAFVADAIRLVMDEANRSFIEEEVLMAASDEKTGNESALELTSRSIDPAVVPEASTAAAAMSHAALLVTRMLPSELDKRVADALVLDTQAILLISERKDTQFYDAVIAHTGYQPFNDYISISVGMMALFEKIFSDTLVREKMIALYKRFNLEMAAGKQWFQNRGDYFLAFFRYIGQYRSPAGAVWQQLLVYFENTTDSIPNAIATQLPSVRKSLRILLNKEEESISAETATSGVVSPEDLAAPADLAKAEAEARLREQLRQQLAAELERERTRLEEEARRKALENVKEKNKRMYIANAGLVILHPFFGFYFTTLGLVAENIFIDEEKRARAVLLMQYLVTGRETFEEHELVLNKILCGMPLEEPIAVEIELTEQERALSDELLNVFKQRWDKVKNSSLESIRASFFLREGVLEETEEGWSLRVEQRGYDMLLQTLPWAFGFIKLPWMNKILTTEWI